MSTEPMDVNVPSPEDAKYAALAHDVQQLKATVATLAHRVLGDEHLHRSSVAAPEDVAPDNDERIILRYLDEGLTPAERAEARVTLDALTALMHEVAAENGITEDALADRFDTARRAASPAR